MRQIHEGRSLKTGLSHFPVSVVNCLNLNEHLPGSTLISPNRTAPAVIVQLSHVVQ